MNYYYWFVIGTHNLFTHFKNNRIHLHSDFLFVPENENEYENEKKLKKVCCEVGSFAGLEEHSGSRFTVHLLNDPMNEHIAVRC